MKKSRLLGAVCACILFIVTPPTVNAATISVTSEAAGTVRNSLDSGLSINGTSSLQMINDGPGPASSNYQFEDRGVAEFDLSGLGVNSVNSSVLTLFDGATNAPFDLPVTIDIYGYSGNGSVGVSDFSPADRTLLASVPYNGETQFDIDVTDFINNQLAIASNFAGFSLLLPNATSDLSVFNFDGSISDNPPVLMLTTVPIPAAVWLFGSGLLGLVGIARRKKAA
ncbi:MAG: VPLPA-CTERM sorting domain-containing protein [Gammaproteobacteria bacterium]